MMWLGPVAVIGGTWLSAEMLLPGGKLQGAPIGHKFSIPALTVLALLGYIETVWGRKKNKEDLDDLASRGELEPLLKTMAEKSPDKKEELCAIGKYYGIRLQD